MSLRAITDIATVLAWAPEQQGTPSQAMTDTLTRCIEAASCALEAACRRRFLSDSYAALHSGDRAATAGDRLYLADPTTLFATLPATVTTVSENTVALRVMPLPFMGSLLDGEFAFYGQRSGTLVRGSVSNNTITRKPWLPGFANIFTMWSAGYAGGDPKETPAMPADLVQACCELSWLMFREGARNGLETLIQQGVNVSFVRMLSPKAQQIVDSYALPRSPVTIEA